LQIKRDNLVTLFRKKLGRLLTNALRRSCHHRHLYRHFTDYAAIPRFLTEIVPYQTGAAVMDNEERPESL
jgi:hypothetical protein